MNDLVERLNTYTAIAELARTLGATVEVDPTVDPGIYAISYAAKGWRVFPLRRASKQPAIPNAHPEGDPLRGKCTGDCGIQGHGFHDATTDLVQVAKWWGHEYPGAGIGWVPDWTTTIVLDLDRHHDGQDGIARFKSLAGSVEPDTMVVRSGGGGLHIFYQRPMGRVSGTGLDKRFGKGHGIDVRANGFLVAPGSIHPVTKRQYFGKITPITAMPYAITRLIIEPDKPSHDVKQALDAINTSQYDDSLADAFTQSSSWREILEPHGWTCITMQADEHGALWRHPAATAPHSALVDEYGNLHVFSPNTVFEASEGRGSGRGYTRFRAWAVLNFNGDMTRAAIELIEQGHRREMKR